MSQERRARTSDAARDMSLEDRAALDQRELEDFKRVTDASLAYLSLEQQLAALLERVTDIVGADTAAILLLDDVRLLQLVADRAALAIDNAQLSEQRALTEVLQRTLLPETLPRIPGLRFSAKYAAGRPGRLRRRRRRGARDRGRVGDGRGPQR